MRPNRVPFAIWLVMLVVSIAAAQSARIDSSESIKRGNARYSRAEYLAAIEEYKKIQPGSGHSYSQALYNIGVCYYELWRTDEAILMYKEADAARSGPYPKALYALGVAFEELERHDEAKAAYRNAVAHSAGRERSLAHFRLGLLLANESDYGKAATHFSGALIGETSPASHNNLGVMLALSGRLQEAEKEFEAALREAGGAFADAAHNLKQCRTLLKASAKNLSGSLRLVATSNTPGQIDTQ